MAKNRIAKKTIDLEKMIVTITFTNGKILEASPDDFDDTIRNHLMLHGLGQKWVDSYAGAETVDLAYLSAKDVLDNLTAGKWSSAVQRTNIWIEALMSVTGASFEEASEKYRKMDEESQKKLKKHKGLIAAKLKIEAERKIAAAAKAKVDVDSELSLDDI